MSAVIQPVKIVWDESLRKRLEDFKDKYSNWTLSAISRSMQQYFTKGRTTDGVSKAVGLGQTTIYNYLNCKWGSSQDALERFEHRLRIWLDARQDGGKTEEVDTSVLASKQIHYGLTVADKRSKFVVIIGPSGQGKSLLTKYYSNAASRGGLVIVEPYSKMTPRAFLASILRALGEVDSGSVDALMQRVIGTLAERQQVLAIDEANFLSAISIDHLVHIYNHVKRGIVLLGTEELEQVIRSSRHQRVRSRTTQTIYLSQMNDEEIKNRLLESFDANEVTKRVVEIARNGSHGSYRDLDDLIDSASELHEKNSGKSLDEIFGKVAPRASGERRRR